MAKTYPINARIWKIVQFAAVCVFWGRAWQHLFWDAPYRTLLWDEVWMSGLVEFVFGMSWEDYVTSTPVDQGIQTSIRISGWIYAFAGLAVIFIRKLGRWSRIIIWLGFINLIFLSLLYFKERFFALGQFFEYSLQMLAPFLVLYLADKNSIGTRFVLLLKWAIVLTFTCHGLYAVGYYPRPVHFQEMVMNILPVQERGAIQFLNVAGILDFVLSIMLFLPWKRWQMIGLGYAIFWGFFTSIARVWAFVHWDFFASGMHQWWFQTVYRFPHFLIPLVVLLMLWTASNTDNDTAVEKSPE